MISISSSYHCSSQIISYKLIRIIYLARFQKHIHKCLLEYDTLECSLLKNDIA